MHCKNTVKSNFIIILKCGHSSCKSCIKTHVIENTNKGNYNSKKIECISLQPCEKSFTRKILLKIFEEKELIKLFDKAANLNWIIKAEENDVSTCQRCDNIYPSNNLQILYCKHEFCKNCLNSEILFLRIIYINLKCAKLHCLDEKCELIINGEVLEKLANDCKN